MVVSQRSFRGAQFLAQNMDKKGLFQAEVHFSKPQQNKGRIMVCSQAEDPKITRLGRPWIDPLLDHFRGVQLPTANWRLPRLKPLCLLGIRHFRLLREATWERYVAEAGVHGGPRMWVAGCLLDRQSWSVLTGDWAETRPVSSLKR